MNAFLVTIAASSVRVRVEYNLVYDEYVSPALRASFKLSVAGITDISVGIFVRLQHQSELVVL